MSSSFDQIIVSEEWENTDVSLLETLDHVLNRGLVIAGEITISVADIDLIFVGLNVMVSSVETAQEVLRRRQPGGHGVPPLQINGPESEQL
jgi:gas vesicle structural protein